MADDGWGTDANAPVFSALSKRCTPEEQAAKEEYVDPLVYASWSKQERKRFQQCKIQMITERIRQKKERTIDDVSKALDALNFFKAQSPVEDPGVTSLIEEISNMKIQQR